MQWVTQFAKEVFLNNSFYFLFCYLKHMQHVSQMVGLYQDPEGKMIFSKTDPSRTNMPPTSDQDTIDSLRRRVQELENEVPVLGYVDTSLWGLACRVKQFS